MPKKSLLDEFFSLVPPSTAQSVSRKPIHLVYKGGPLLTNIEVLPIFWGDAWYTPQLRLLNQTLYVFFLDLVESSLIDQLKEYNVPNYPIGYGSVPKTYTIPHHFKFPFTSDKDIQQMLSDQINNGTLPPVSANRLYFVFTPPSVKIQKGIGMSCLTFCGYHDKSTNGAYYAVISYPDCTPCLGGLSVQDAITSIASHELCEAITDPIPGKGWYDDTRGEIGDVCAWQNKTLPDSSYTVQKEWSNSQNKCI